MVLGRKLTLKSWHTRKQGRSSNAASIRRAPSLCCWENCQPQYAGFASTEEGNILTEEQQWAKKLRMIVELADERWGS